MDPHRCYRNTTRNTTDTQNCHMNVCAQPGLKYSKSGLGINMIGTVNIVITIKLKGNVEPNIGLGSVPNMAMAIIELMMLGGFSKGVTHLYRI